MVRGGREVGLADASQIRRDALLANGRQGIAVEGDEVGVAQLDACLYCTGGNQRRYGQERAVLLPRHVRQFLEQPGQIVRAGNQLGILTKLVEADPHVLYRQWRDVDRVRRLARCVLQKHE